MGVNFDFIVYHPHQIEKDIPKLGTTDKKQH